MVQSEKGMSAAPRSNLEHVGRRLSPGGVVWPYEVVGLLLAYHVVAQVDHLHRQVPCQRLFAPRCSDKKKQGSALERQWRLVTLTTN